MVKSCWICKTADNKLKKSYFRVPKILNHRNSEITELSAVRLEKWRNVLHLPDDTSGIRICSDHFISGNPGRLLDINDPDWIPTKNLMPKVNKNVEFSGNMNASVLKITEKVEKPQEVDQITCRLCFKLVSKKVCINIFQDLNKKIAGMIGTILGHKIVFELGVSSQVCNTCLKKVRICASLLNYFRKNEKLMVKPNLLANGTPVEYAESDESHPKGKIEKDENVYDTVSAITEPMECKSSAAESLGRSTTNAVQIDGLYDSEQIRSIVEYNSTSSEEDSAEDRKFVRCKKRKYDFQTVNLKPIEVKTSKCNNCFRKFNDLESLKIHKNFCKLLYCQLCKPQITFRSRDERDFHKKKYHNHSLICHICGKKYSQSYLVKHFRNHFQDRQKCPFCSKTLKNMTILMSHVDNVHGNRSSKVCEVCGGNFKNLKKHLVLCRESGN